MTDEVELLVRDPASALCGARFPLHAPRVLIYGKALLLTVTSLKPAAAALLSVTAAVYLTLTVSSKERETVYHAAVSKSPLPPYAPASTFRRFGAL